MTPVPGPRSGPRDGPAFPAPPSPAPGCLRAASALVGAQGVLLVGLAGFYGVRIVSGAPSDVVAATLSAAMALVAGVCLILVANGLRRARGWARTPALVTQMLVLTLAWPALQAGSWVIGVGLAAWAVAIAVLLFLPASNAALHS